MKYLLDFDHTLFDTEKFIRAVSDDGKIDMLFTEKVWSYFDAQDFLYGDGLDFLKSQNQSDLVILTAYTPSHGAEAEIYQRKKLVSARMTEYVSDVVIMEGNKASHVERITEGEPAVFVDDSPEHLVATEVRCPHVTCVQIIRPGIERAQAGSTIKVIESLRELDSITI